MAVCGQECHRAAAVDVAFAACGALAEAQAAVAEAHVEQAAPQRYVVEQPTGAVFNGKMAAAMVQGIQSRGIAASLKHFACNNKETNRKESDSRVSERALREIYLKGFEICVREAQPLTVMSAYNLVNGQRASENRDLLTGILREEWGFEGLVTSDWYTHGEQYAEIAAGNDIKMGRGMPAHTLQMLREGRISREQIKTSVARLLKVILRLA